MQRGQTQNSEPLANDVVQRDDIVKQYWSRMKRAAAGYEVNITIREELAQEMALEVWRSLPRFNGQCSLNTYIYRIIHNVAVDHIRRATRQIKTYESDEEGTDNLGPEKELEQAQQQSKLVAAVRKLPLSLRQVVLLKLEDLSNIEIADTLGLTESNVGVRLNRGKQALVKLLEGAE